MRWEKSIAAAILSLHFGTAVTAQMAAPRKSAQGVEPAPGNERCSSCHAEIYKSYLNTVMASASGAAADGVVTGEFYDKDSGVRYRVYEQAGRVWMSFDREGKNAIRGQRELDYFIGSGVKGRTYLFWSDGFLFETPINWYSQERRWNMTPAYTQAQEIPMNLPAYPSCLNCHTSGMQVPAAGTDSNFTGQPFLHAGITCERCHGADVSHAQGKGAEAASTSPSRPSSSIVNPAKLSADRRDSICMECHFEGTAAVEQPGKHLYEFQPGERISDYVHYFVLAGSLEPEPQAVSQFQALSQSACQRASGDKMWCGSCHDPHREPAATEKVAFYRAKCLACHGQGSEGEEFAAKHHPERPDCAACHMPPLPSKDVAHTEATDHRIMRYPNTLPLPRLQIRGKPLKSFPASDESLVTTRDYALAWEALAQRGVDGAERRAQEYLEKAVMDSPDDADLLAALGFQYQRHFHENDARELYERALKIDPLLVDAATNLGILEARMGDAQQAVKLWQEAFRRAPHRSVIGMNLALVFCAAGQKDIARKYLERVLEFNPDYGKGRSLLAHLGEENGQCKP
jgi:Tetratricopeptide repeat/Cytochrome c554 and c-prime